MWVRFPPGTNASKFQAQGVLTDNTNGQRWYVYAQFGEPGSGKITWYAYPVPGKGEIMENSFNHSNLNNF
jgi:hypothetical protein